jgi:hypothetical protein
VIVTRPSLLLAAAVVAALGGCHTGPSTRSFQPAATPHGARVTLGIGNSTLAGELVEVRDSALVVSSSDSIWVVDFSSIRRARFPGFFVAYGGGVPTREAADRMRMVSRFPAGMPAGVMERLLAASGQAAPLTVRP